MISNQKILVVDDNPTNLRLLEILLEPFYDVVIAADGFEALDACKREDIDLILLDIKMPKMDGYEVCERLKGALGTNHIPIIFLTAETGTESIVRAFEAGGVDYVTKPFNKVELLARVKTHIEMKILRGILPICASCKKIRDDKGYWNQIETYIQEHSEVAFSHGICQECAIKLYPDHVSAEGKIKE